MKGCCLHQSKKNIPTSNIDLVIYDEVDSTNEELRRILASSSHEVPTGGVDDSRMCGANRGDSSTVDSYASDTYLDDSRVNECAAPQKTVKAVMALRQTKGRGRLGRNWESPPGGLYLSLALDITDAASGQAALSLITALALREVLAEQVEPAAHAEKIPQQILQEGGALQTNQVPLLTQTPEQTQRSVPTKRATQEEGSKTTAEHILVKWPNDILCARGKLVGILVESVQVAPSKRAAIIGAGINIVRPAEGVSPAAAYLSDLTHQIPELEEIARKAARSVLAYYSAWQAAGYSFAPFAEAYTANMTLRGQSITVSNGKAQKVATGIVQGVDSNGYLLLKDENGSVTKISAGEVTLRSVCKPEL